MICTVNLSLSIDTSINVDIDTGITHQYWYEEDAKATVLMLKAMKEKSEKASNEMSDLTKELIENGAVNQWAKKPIYYFVKGLRKVALVIDEGGDFKVSKKYPATSDKDQAYLKALGIKS
ncbi:hypothetical protein ACWOAN_02310 [Lactococcus taiwanensis]|uniref:hypothetical protein n=1 Tax=Lactococcus taiwanensis TaxID=1151742 RepID=UPI0019087238|nr:hypothetical protein [Lactococcus taiwanensis]